MVASTFTESTGRLAERLAPARVGPAAVVIGLLVCTDLVMIVLHLAHRSVQVTTRVPVLKSQAFNISGDHGIAESFGYVQLFWVVVLLLWVGLFGNRRSFLPWALLFAYLLADDLLALHESAGTALVHAVGEQPKHLIFGGLRMQDLGELVFAGSVGLVLLALLAWGYRRGTARTRTAYRRLLVVSLELAVFGMLVDGLATGVGDSGLQLLHLLEDGGELFAVSAVLGCVVLEVSSALSKAGRAGPAGG